jgi:hypothetical protein
MHRPDDDDATLDGHHAAHRAVLRHPEGDAARVLLGERERGAVAGAVGREGYSSVRVILGS